ncbi:GFA family protein [Mesorhizobium sp. CAU 1741]|uniref:GFA family protein n=1 Tax=Mesorhizobium sp. CAU 1741 TaxID=3140366 RepID=UPI00325B125B
MTADEHERTGGCHCGAVRFRVRLAEGLDSARRCDCSLCRMRGAVAVTARQGDLTITQGEDMLALYTFNTEVAEHYFCSRCGIYTHHRRRSDPTQFGVNAACLDGVSPFDFSEVIVTNGRQHPNDRAQQPGPSVVGTLTFTPATER